MSEEQPRLYNLIKEWQDKEGGLSLTELRILVNGLISRVKELEADIDFKWEVIKNRQDMLEAGNKRLKELEDAIRKHRQTIDNYRGRKDQELYAHPAEPSTDNDK